MSAEFATPDSVKSLCFYLHQQLQIVHSVREVAGRKTSKTWKVVYPLLWAVGDSCDSVMKLAIHGKMRDCVGVTRTAFETIVNVSYISAVGDSAAERAESHARQKSFRELKRFVQFKEEHLGGPKIEDTVWDQLARGSSSLQSALDEFTSQKGREKPWTPESVRMRIEAIAEEFDDELVKGLEIAVKGIYQDASEIAHGTLYGAFFALGMEKGGPVTTPEELDRFRLGWIAEMLALLNFSVNTMLRIISKRLPIAESVEQSRHIVDTVGERFWPPEKTNQTD